MSRGWHCFELHVTAVLVVYGHVAALHACQPQSLESGNREWLYADAAAAVDGDCVEQFLHGNGISACPTQTEPTRMSMHMATAKGNDIVQFRLTCENVNLILQ